MGQTAGTYDPYAGRRRKLRLLAAAAALGDGEDQRGQLPRRAMMLFMMRGMTGTKGDSEPKNEAGHDVHAPVDAKNGRQDR